ncbi:MAG: hypothetical protein J6M02_03045 [Clostridia bacterium]|nr:hypothetical protein [Clostridia bacterium]
MKKVFVMLFALITLFCTSSAIAEYVPETYDLWISESILNDFLDTPVSLKLLSDGRNLLQVGPIESDIPRTEIKFQYADSFTWTEEELLKTVKLLTGKQYVSIRKAYYAIEEKHGKINAEQLHWNSDDKTISLETEDGMAYVITDVHNITNGCFIPEEVYLELIEQ